MLPDYPNLKRKFRQRLIRFMQGKINERAPMMARISHFRQWEGADFSLTDPSGTTKTSSAREVKAGFSIPRNLPPLKTIQEVFMALNAAAEDMARQSETMLFQRLDESVRESGNILDCAGRPFAPAVLLESLDKMWIDFDENGKPEMPTIVLHPDLFNSIKDRLPEWEADPEFRAKHQEIIARKKEEWRDRESNRKLVG